MTLRFSCSDKDYPEIEMFFFNQEMDERPCYDYILLRTDSNEYLYEVKEEHNKWYIVA